MLVENHSFCDQVDSWVLESILQGATNLEEVVFHLPGVYPTEVRDSIIRMRSKGQCDSDFPVRANSREDTPPECFLDAGHHVPHTKLPIPHPLDFDWRFSPVAIDRLLRGCMEFSQDSESIVLLGAPSLLSAALSQCLPRQMWLIDRCKHTLESLRPLEPVAQIIECDLLHDPLPNLNGRVVVCDPPWYMEHMKSFLWAASRLSLSQCHILLSMPAVGTRPGVLDERKAILVYAEELGLRLLNLECGVLPYNTPPFERNALIADGIGEVSLQWRRADLALFSRIAQSSVQRPAYDRTASESWTDDIVRGVRFFLREKCEEGFADPSLIPVIAGDILPSVSRRDKRRGLVDIWTSGNRVFRCQGPNVLRQILRSFSSGRSPSDHVSEYIGRALNQRELELTCKASKRIQEILSLEQVDPLFFRGKCAP